jgi:hypothetical protein
MIETIKRWLKRVGVGGGALLIAGYVLFFIWSLPSHDRLRVIGTETRRGDVENSEGDMTSRDVRYVMAEDLDGSPRMFRNEDTGWWPPYLKFDSGDVAAQAEIYATDASKPTILVSHYGFRIPVLSAFPNLLHMEVAKPDHQPIPWLTIFVLMAHAALIGVVVVFYRNAKRGRAEKTPS